MKFTRFAMIQGALLLVFMAMPSVAADWSAWKQRMPIRLGRIDAESFGALPIEATISLKAADMSDPKNPARELRLVYFKDNKGREVPFQISRTSAWERDTSPSVATFNAQITFFPVSGDQSGTYTLLYHNEKAREPDFKTDLKVSGEGPHWTIENSLMTVQLREGDKVKRRVIDDWFGDSGQLGVVTLKSRPKSPITNGNRILHWNPGVYIPKRGWVHPYVWDPPAEYEIEQGPVFVEVRRRGPLPTVPEVEVAITYRIYKERTYVQVGTRLEARKDIGVAAVRNNEVIFSEKLFTRMAWEQFGDVHDEAISKYKPAGPRRGDIIRLKPDTPWFAFYEPGTKIGAAYVFVSEDNVGPWGNRPPEFNHALFITHDLADRQVFWVRSQDYFSKDWDRKQLITIPQGSVYAEQNYYYFYDVEQSGAFESVRQLSRAVNNPPDVRVGPYGFPPPQ
ncbi:hypothetical protein LLG95_18335 [bacterium]|nr:hypothetical protein [bacterium]